MSDSPIKSVVFSFEVVRLSQITNWVGFWRFYKINEKEGVEILTIVNLKDDVF